jgi:hypothetical protein
MKVQCVSVTDALDRPAPASPWLTVGRTYNVLSVVLDVHSRWWFRLISDQRTDIGLFRREQFQIVSTKLPSTWVISWSHSGAFELSPQAWLVPGFWESYFEGDSDARSTFDRELKRIVDSEL